MGRPIVIEQVRLGQCHQYNNLLTREDRGWSERGGGVLQYSGVSIHFNTVVGIKNSKEGKEVLSRFEMLGTEGRGGEIGRVADKWH